MKSSVYSEVWNPTTKKVFYRNKKEQIATSLEEHQLPLMREGFRNCPIVYPKQEHQFDRTHPRAVKFWETDCCNVSQNITVTSCADVEVVRK